MRHDALSTMPCAIARSMAVLGERWTLVILRSAFTGARRFEDYQSSTSIARNILTDRLKTLVDHGILARRPYAEHPGRTLYEYRLTEKGLDLYPVLVSLMQWGNRYGGFEDGPPVELEHKLCGQVATPCLVCTECGEELRPREVHAHGPPGRRNVVIARSATATLAALVAALMIAAPADAQERVETVESGAVRAELRYVEHESALPTGMHLLITSAGATVVDESIAEDEFLSPGGFDDDSSLYAADFDGDGTAEVVLDIYTGGAHCCFEAWIYHGAAKVVHTFGDVGYRFVDVDDDGSAEFLSADPGFSAAFTSFAGSQFPLQVWRWQQGALVDVTRSEAVKPRLRTEASRFRRAYARASARLSVSPRSLRAAEQVRSNLAAYAADQCSLGRCDAGFDLVRRAARRGDIRAGRARPRRAGRAYARDLRAHLKHLGYLR